MEMLLNFVKYSQPASSKLVHEFFAEFFICDDFVEIDILGG